MITSDSSLCYIATDLGGTNVRAARFSPQGKLLARAMQPTAADKDADTLLACVADTIRQVLPPDPAQVIAIGLGSPGPLNPYTGVIIRPPNLPAWKDFPLRDKLSAIFELPVCINNDANVAALGEWQYGAGRGHNDLLYLTISTGIGSGVITGGRPLLGHKGLAPELGHVTIVPNGPLCGCGQRGHLEALASGTAIARTAHERLRMGASSSLHEMVDGGEIVTIAAITAEHVGQAAQANDLFARDLIDEAGRYIGLALAGFLHAFNPSIVVFGGGVSMLGEMLFAPVRAAIRQYVISPDYWQDCKLVESGLHDDAGLYGALVLARQQYPLDTL